ncbi:YkgJ family cysteine cluster protein [Streptomyces sp. NBC_01451]|uniref:YkgJ family cysteine cluster protein n=1 Tax=Streptomyces sp. NBC_01451 TaxID=2903872 RepID=UPI002E378C7B|nr:YkgJ family cysteine cluster protein [Streptomyces sp. NBC_01451]
MKLGDAEALVRLVAGGLARDPDPAALDALYESLPRLECQRKCGSACGPVPLSPLERNRIRASGVRWVDGRVITLSVGQRVGTTCTALDQEKMQCRAYEVRPMVCRIWGLVEELACPWGCMPEGGYLDTIEGLRLMNLSLWYGGDLNGMEPSKWERLAANPHRRRLAAEFLAQAKPVQEDARIIQTTIPVRLAS